MTEAEWLRSTDPEVICWNGDAKRSERKWRLIALAWCSRCPPPRTQVSRWLDTLLTQFVDDCSLKEKVASARYQMQQWNMLSVYEDEMLYTSLINATHPDARTGLGQLMRDVRQFLNSHRNRRRRSEIGRNWLAWCADIRCIVGNPLRPVAFDPRWRTADVLGVARGVYEERAFDRLPVLMDALLDAGCDNADVLDHCRSPGPHVRGCWVVDLILGKT
jgi:hypothetical protein